jgi:hypothetical protein
MLKRPALWWLILALAASLMAGSGALGETKYRLRDAYSPGDTCTVDNSMDMSVMLTVNVPGSGQGDQQLPFSVRHRESYREKVLAVDQKGPSAFRRTYTVARTVTTDPYLNETTKVSSLQGKTVTVRRVGDHVAVTAEPGKLSPEDEKSMTSELSHTESAFFPDHDVAPGEEWPIDPHLMIAFFPGMEKASARFRFQQVASFAGHPSAQIHTTMEVQGQDPSSGVPMTIKLSGDMYRALDLKRTVAEDDTGPVTMEGQKEQNGMRIHFSGHGTMHIKETHRWLQVNGQPVKANG